MWQLTPCPVAKRVFFLIIRLVIWGGCPHYIPIYIMLRAPVHRPSVCLFAPIHLFYLFF